MAEINTVARPYAVALFDLAHESASLPTWSRQLCLLASLAGYAEVNEAMSSPNLDQAAKVRLMADLAGLGQEQQVLNLLEALVANHRTPILPAIAAQFEALKDAAENAVEAFVTSAFALSAAQEQELATLLERRLNKKVRIVADVNAALIGGVQIRVADQVLDASIQGKLQALSKRLMN